MKKHQLKRGHNVCRRINLDEVWSMITEKPRFNYKNNKGEKAPVTRFTRAVCNK